MVRENEILESYKSLVDNRNKRAAKMESAILNAAENKNQFVKNYYNLVESRQLREREHGKLLAEARDNAFGTVLKAIYITAMEPEALTENAIFAAENMVDQYIKESGGARAIFNNAKADTYLLAKLRSLVEETAIKLVEEIENINEEDIKDVEVEFDEESEEKEADDNVAVPEEQKEDEKATSEEAEKDNAIAAALDDAGIEIVSKDEEKEAPAEDVPEAEPSEDEEDEAPELEDDTTSVPEPSEDEAAEENTPEETQDAAESEAPEEDQSSEENIDVDDSLETIEDEEDDEDIDIDDVDVDEEDEEEVEDDETINKDPNKSLFKELENEKEVKDAIELIKTRVADAEEAFVKRNAEDKQKIEELLGKISDNVNTVEKIANNDDVKSKIAQESAIMNRRKINEISNNKPLTIMERMTRNLTSDIIKNEAIKETYLTESGSLDTALVVESAKVMYGFLETLNTLQLESVDSKYIQKILG